MTCLNDEVSTVLASRRAMATVFEVMLAGHDPQYLDAVATAMLDEVVRVEQLLSRFDPASEISRLNREAACRPVRIERELWDLLLRCQRAWHETAGAFDITAQSGRRSDAWPLELDAARSTVRLTDPRVRLDLGGIGKGHALDRAAEIGRRAGVTDALLHSGGSSVLAWGAEPGRSGWRVKLDEPHALEGGEACREVTLHDEALSVSATFHNGDDSISDIIHPRTGRPLNRAESCLALAPTATEAEIVSTAGLALGRRRVETQVLRARSDASVATSVWSRVRCGWSASEQRGSGSERDGTPVIHWPSPPPSIPVGTACPRTAKQWHDTLESCGHPSPAEQGGGTLPPHSPARRTFLATAGAALAAGLLPFEARAEEKQSEERSPVRVGVIGAGARGSDLIRALSTIDGVELAGVCDDYPPHLEQGVRYAGGQAQAFSDYRALLERLRPHCVVIAVPLASHYEVASAALASGCDVFLEKTMCYSIEDARRLAEQVRAAGRVFQVGLQRRANPIYQQAAAMVEAGLIGRITSIQAQWHRNNSWRRPIPLPRGDAGYEALERRLNWRLYEGTSGGLMAELGSHQMDVANWFLGTSPRRVFATGGIDYWHDGREVFDNISCMYEYEVLPPLRLRGRSDPRLSVAEAAVSGAAPVPSNTVAPYTVRVSYSSLCNNAYQGAAELILGTEGTLYLTSTKGLLFREPTADRIPWSQQSGRGAAEANAAVVTAGKTLKLANDPWAHRGQPIEIDAAQGNDTRDELLAFIDHVRRHDPRTIADAGLGLQNAATVLLANEAARQGTRLDFPRDLAEIKTG